MQTVNGTGSDGHGQTGVESVAAPGQASDGNEGESQAVDGSDGQVQTGVERVAAPGQVSGGNEGESQTVDGIDAEAEADAGTVAAPLHQAKVAVKMEMVEVIVNVKLLTDLN